MNNIFSFVYNFYTLVRTHRLLAFKYQVSKPLATQSKADYRPLYHFVKLRSQKPFATVSKASSLSCDHYT